MSSSSQRSPWPLAPVAFRDLIESLADDKMVNIVPNDDNAVLRIQRTLLLHLSPWFRKALTNGFIEGRTLTLRFPGVPSDVIETFVYWIFHGVVCWGDSSSEAGMPKTHQELQALLARLWMFGEEHLLPELQHVAMCALDKQLTYEYPNLELLLEVYEGTAPDSLLRKVMAREAASGWRNKQRPNPSGNVYGYSRDDLDRVGAVPGFTADFATALERQVIEAHLYGDSQDAFVHYPITQEALSPEEEI
ncbi:hypothetical protein NU219Hw_g9182t1 [Hortaea werneckii]